MRAFVLLLLLALGAPAVAQTADSLAADLEAMLGHEVATEAAHRERASQAAASITIITADEIDRAGHRTIADVLATVRGFTISDDRSYSYVGVRGISRPGDLNKRIALYVNGVPARDGFNGAAPLDRMLGVPLVAVERIEITRGPGSVTYGTGAMFAVVNVVLKDVRTLDGVRGAIAVGENGRYEGEAVAATELGRGVGVSAAVQVLESDGTDVYFPEFDALGVNGGVAEGLDWERAHGYVGALQVGGIRLDLRYGERTKGTSTAPNGTAFGLDAYSRDRSASASLRVGGALSPQVSVVGTAALNHSHVRALFPYIVPELLGPDPFDLTYRSNATVARTEGRLQWDAGPAHRVVAGAEVQSQFQSRFVIEGEGFPISEGVAPFTSGSVYAQIESALSQGVAVQGGTRVDASGGDIAVLPRGALVVAPDDRTQLKLVVGTAFRAPAPGETVTDLLDEDRLTRDKLRSERVTTIEATAARHVSGHLYVEASAFSTSVRDVIVTLFDFEARTLTYANAERDRARGVELGAVATAGGWRGRASLGLQRAWNPDAEADAALPNAPERVAKATAFGPLGRGLWLALDGRLESGRQTLYGDTTDPYAVVDASLSADLFGGVGRLTLEARNLFDADYAMPGGPDHLQLSTIPQRPRAASLRLDVRL